MPLFILWFRSNSTISSSTLHLLLGPTLQTPGMWRMSFWLEPIGKLAKEPKVDKIGAGGGGLRHAATARQRHCRWPAVGRCQRQAGEARKQPVKPGYRRESGDAVLPDLVVEADRRDGRGQRGDQCGETNLLILDDLNNCNFKSNTCLSLFSRPTRCSFLFLFFWRRKWHEVCLWIKKETNNAMHVFLKNRRGGAPLVIY